MPLPALKKVQHFRFSADHPGTVFYRVRSEDPEQAFNLMRSSTSFPVAGDLQASDPPGSDSGISTTKFENLSGLMRRTVLVRGQKIHFHQNLARKSKITLDIGHVTKMPNFENSRWRTAF